MSNDELRAVLNKIAVAYPNFTKGRDVNEIKTTWAEAIGDREYDVVSEAVAEYIESERFYPTPADILTRCKTKTGGNRSASWEALCRVMRLYSELSGGEEYPEYKHLKKLHDDAIRSRQ